MLCPHCGGKTTVYDTDRNPNGETLRLRKCLVDPSHRIKTKEKVIERRIYHAGSDGRSAEVRRYFRDHYHQRKIKDPEKIAYYRQRGNLRKQARAQALESGRPVQELYELWGVTSKRDQWTNPKPSTPVPG